MPAWYVRSPYNDVGFTCPSIWDFIYDISGDRFMAPTHFLPYKVTTRSVCHQPTVHKRWNEYKMQQWNSFIWFGRLQSNCKTPKDRQVTTPHLNRNLILRFSNPHLALLHKLQCTVVSNHDSVTMTRATRHEAPDPLPVQLTLLEWKN